jgi:hypothetical protein
MQDLIPILGGIFGTVVAWLVFRKFWPQSGKWAINTAPLFCAVCRTEAARARIPKSKRELLWGGWTCSHCGTELDKFGHPVRDDYS